LRSALDLVGEFPQELEIVIEREWQKNSNPVSRSQLLLPLLRQANNVADFIESNLAHGTRMELSESLVDELIRELKELGLSQYGVVTSHGAANNFVTQHTPDLRDHILGPLNPLGGTQAGAPKPFALFKIPRIEGTGVQWRPILLGHEVAHVAVREKSALQTYTVWWDQLDQKVASTFSNPRSPTGTPYSNFRGIQAISESWATELLCDAYALFRYGPAAIAALAEYLTSISAMDSSSPTHPPGVLRLRLLLDQLGTLSNPRIKRIIQPWDDQTPASVTLSEPWAQYLATVFLGHPGTLDATVSGFGAHEYVHADRNDIVEVLTNRLKLGIPGQELVDDSRQGLVAPVDSDIVNAVWVARVEGCQSPFDSLGKKALENLEFMRRWTTSGGTVPNELHQALTSGTPLLEEEKVAVLSSDQLTQRLRIDDERRLFALPLVQLPKGVGLDVRLGNRFIVFRRAGTASFDPLDSQEDPRSIQMHLELSWTERFVLHPHEVVLGATLEYLVFPSDLTGQVITRSSYGRLGLLSATAVQIHPRFHGCLTLELVNLSNIPISLTPGERIAQLVISSTRDVAEEEEKYSYPTGPQFSRVREDPEAGVLRHLRGSAP
jgi:deoxycytidine triphosphate deaminase